MDTHHPLYSKYGRNPKDERMFSMNVLVPCFPGEMGRSNGKKAH